MAELPEVLPRRHWLLDLLAACIAATVAAVVYPVVRFLWPRPATSSGAMEVIAKHRLSDLRRGPQPPFDFGGKPCLLVLTPDGKKRLDGHEPLEPGDLKAFNAVCTHLDCTVEFRPETSDIFCNCHNGLYDLNGRNVSGPPPRPLESYKVTLAENKEDIIVSRNA